MRLRLALIASLLLLAGLVLYGATRAFSRAHGAASDLDVILTPNS